MAKEKLMTKKRFVEMVGIICLIIFFSLRQFGKLILAILIAIVYKTIILVKQRPKTFQKFLVIVFSLMQLVLPFKVNSNYSYSTCLGSSQSRQIATTYSHYSSSKRYQRQKPVSTLTQLKPAIGSTLIGHATLRWHTLERAENVPKWFYWYEIISCSLECLLGMVLFCEPILLGGFAKADADPTLEPSEIFIAATILAGPDLVRRLFFAGHRFSCPKCHQHLCMCHQSGFNRLKIDYNLLLINHNKLWEEYFEILHQNKQLIQEKDLLTNNIILTLSKDKYQKVSIDFDNKLGFNSITALPLESAVSGIIQKADKINQDKALIASKAIRLIKECGDNEINQARVSILEDTLKPSPVESLIGTKKPIRKKIRIKKTKTNSGKEKRVFQDWE